MNIWSTNRAIMCTEINLTLHHDIMLIQRQISVLSGRSSKVKSLNFVIWWQSKRPLRQDKHGHYFLISHLLFVLQYFYHNFESCCWTIYTNRKIILHDVFVQLQSIFNSTNINHGQSYPIFGFWLKYQPFLVYKRLNNEDIIYLLLHSTIFTYIATTRTL